MTKSNITEYDNTAANNTDVEDVPLGENQMYPSDVNNAFREIMADLADVNDGTVSLTSPSFAAASLTGNLSFGDNNKAIFGAGSDLEIYHDGSNSWIHERGTGNLNIEGRNVFIIGANNDTILAGFIDGAESRLYHNGSQKLATTSTGIDVTGTVTADGLTVNNVFSFDNSGFNGEIKTYGSGTGIIYDALNGYHTFRENGTARMQIRAGGDIYLGYEDTGTTPKLTWDASEEDLKFADNSKALFGAGSDLQIYHDGTASYIRDAGTGGLVIQASENLKLQSHTGEFYFQGIRDGASKIYYDNAEKLVTTSTGIDVTGTVTADGLTVEGTINAYRAGFTQGVQLLGDSGANQIIGTATNDKRLIIKNQAATQGIEIVVNNRAMDIANNGDISFYEDTGTTAKLFWDASAERLGLGTTSPSAKIDVVSDTAFLGKLTATNGYIDLVDPAVTGRLQVSGNVFFMGTTASGDMVAFKTGANTERMRIDSSGNVLVGTTSDNVANQTGTTQGVRIAGGSIKNIQVASTGTTAYFNRLATDGSIAEFRRNGTTVGSIGTVAGDIVIGTGTAGLRFWDSGPAIQPRNSDGSANNDAIDLGISTSRFKDLHLSNSAYVKNIGGTSDADTYLNFGDVANTIKAFTGGSERMRLDASGNLLVGTTDPDVANSASVEGISIRGGSNFLGIARSGLTVAKFNRQSSDGDIVAFGKDGTTVGTIGVDNSDNLYIQGTSTAAGLQFGDGGSGQILPHKNGSDIDNTIDFGNTGNRFKDLYLSGGLRADTLTFSNLAGTERMRIDSSGNVHINTGGSQAGATVSGTTIRGLDILKSTNTTNSSNQVVFYNPNGAVGVIRTIGSSTSYVSLSDYRLKENVTDITDGIERVKQLNPSRFNFIADADTTVDGFIAHKAQTVVPEAVTGEKDAMRDEEYEVTPAVLDDNGNVVTEAVMGIRSVPDYQGIDQAKLVPLLTAALQEAITKIEDLEARVATLEGN